MTMIDVSRLPKAELHVHLEGSLEPEMLLELAARNGVDIPFHSEEEARAACHFTDLQSFLNLYYAGLRVLRTPRDFAEVTHAYLTRAHADRVRHAEIYFSPQGHLRRGIAFADMMEGVIEGMTAARADMGISSGLILGLQRQYAEDEGFEVLDLAWPYRQHVLALGLGGPEVGNPPEKFTRVFAEARRRGWHTVAHAGEEGDAGYVRQAMDLLHVDRIDHGVRCAEDPALVRTIAERGITLTVCPLSNVCLRVFPDIAAHNLGTLLRAGVKVTINSDDPPYFGGYIDDNFRACQTGIGLSDADIITVARNGFTGSFLPAEEVAVHLAELDGAVREWQAGAMDA